MYNNLSVPDIPKENAFHFIRLFACLVVIYEHSIFLTQVSLPSLHLSETAVKIFFILSGFWVTLSLLRSKNIKEYAIKRIKKIFPPYCLVVLLTAIVLNKFSTLPANDYFLDSRFWKYIIANILTMNFIEPTLPGVFEGFPLNGAVNGSLWTIKIEVAFYVLLPLVISIINNHKLYIKHILITLYCFSVLYIIGCHFLIIRYSSLEKLEHQFPAFVTCFVTGMTFAFFWDKLQKIIDYLIIPSFIGALICLKFGNWLFIATVLPICLSIVIFWIAIKLTILRFVVEKDFSFGMYLVHVPIINVFILKGFFEMCWELAFVGILGVTFLLSYILIKTCRFIK